MSYTFLDAAGATQTASSSIIGGANYAQVFVQGSVATYGTVTQVGTQISSISGLVDINSVIGTYAEDSQHATGDKAMFVLGVRNDTLSSITSLDGDYSPHIVGPAGEGIVANAPLTKWVQGVASAFTGVIQPIIPAQGASVFTYITSGQVVNNSSLFAYITLYGATSSVVGYLPAPANSGAIPFMANGWKTNANGAFSASISGIASVFLSFQGFISKT